MDLLSCSGLIMFMIRHKAQRESHLFDKIPAHLATAVALVWRQVTVIMVALSGFVPKNLPFGSLI